MAAALVADRDMVRRLAPHAARGLAVGLVVGGVLLAWPVWFALQGPAHLSGLVWPNVGVIGGFIPSSFVSAGYPNPHNVFVALGGYEGAPLASAAYLGWGFLAVLFAGTVAFRRDRRLWFFGFVLVLCGVCSLGERQGQWEPAWVFTKLPLIENVIEQRFMAVGFLAGRSHAGGHPRAHPSRWLRTGAASRPRSARPCVALVPMAVTFAPRLPFTMRPVILPRWYTEVAPTLPSGRVLLSYPAPFSGIQSAMSWQAVNRMHYSQAGGGGPQGVASRAGPAASGFKVLGRLGFAVGVPSPAGTPAQYAAVRHALAEWRVTTVVIATNPAAPSIQQGHDPTYAAAFMTGALGRLPRVQAGAWVWDNVQVGLPAPLRLKAGTLGACVRVAEGRSGQVMATMRAPTASR